MGTEYSGKEEVHMSMYTYATRFYENETCTPVTWISSVYAVEFV